MAEQYANDAVSVLATSISSSATTLTVASAAAFPTPAISASALTARS